MTFCLDPLLFIMSDQLLSDYILKLVLIHLVEVHLLDLLPRKAAAPSHGWARLPSFSEKPAGYRLSSATPFSPILPSSPNPSRAITRASRIQAKEGGNPEREFLSHECKI